MPDVDPPGTCHLVGCPGKGTLDKHVPSTDGPVEIGAGSWEDYDKKPEHCLGFPIAQSNPVMAHLISVRCSINSTTWGVDVHHIGPTSWAELVDKHKAECPNRKPR